jgi:D-serine deaminase-like pyridoxal phosphate-dependent protein
MIQDLSIDRPILFLDEHRCKRNIETMIRRANSAGAELRPHMKTHQSITVARWFRERGVQAATVSSASMAHYFAKDGWKDITIAFPYYRAMTESLKHLEDVCKIRLFINSVDDLDYLEKKLIHPFRFYIEIDPGYGRSGISYKNRSLINRLARYKSSSGQALFHGFYIHEGRTYQARGVNEIEKRITPALSILKNLKSDFPDSVISIGDTPSCSVSKQLGVLDEMTPGNFVFYDYMQYQIGSCSLDDVALFAKLPIAQASNSADRTILNGGAAHLSKEYIRKPDIPTYGRIVRISADRIETVGNAHIRSLSQEHAIVEGLNNLPNAETHVWVCPIHSCLTANLFSEYKTLSGETINKRTLS